MNSTPAPDSPRLACTLGGRSAQRILIVEDDEAMCGLIAQVLAEEGYSVSCFGSGTAALAHMAIAHDDLKHFDLIVSDQLMPGLTGIELAKWSRWVGGPPTLLISAYADDRLRLEASSHGVIEVLAKPFALSSLVRAVRAILHAN